MSRHEVKAFPSRADRYAGRSPYRVSNCQATVTGNFGIFGNDITVSIPGSGLVLLHLVDSLPRMWHVDVGAGRQVEVFTPNSATLWPCGGTVSAGGVSFAPPTRENFADVARAAISADKNLIMWRVTRVPAAALLLTAQQWPKATRVALPARTMYPDNQARTGTLAKPRTTQLNGSVPIFAGTGFPAASTRGSLFHVTYTPAEYFSYLTQPPGWLATDAFRDTVNLERPILFLVLKMALLDGSGLFDWYLIGDLTQGALYAEPSFTNIAVSRSFINLYDRPNCLIGIAAANNEAPCNTEIDSPGVPVAGYSELRISWYENTTDAVDQCEPNGGGGSMTPGVGFAGLQGFGPGIMPRVV